MHLPVEELRAECRAKRIMAPRGMHLEEEDTEKILDLLLFNLCEDTFKEIGSERRCSEIFLI